MCTDENSDKSKMNLPLSPSGPVKIFIIAEKTTKPMALQFSDFQFVSIKYFVTN